VLWLSHQKNTHYLPGVKREDQKTAFNGNKEIVADVKINHGNSDFTLIKGKER
jgi:hypothetical protein